MARDQLDDWQVLGIPPGASLEEAFRAYSRRKAIYSPDSLASYSLHDDESRRALLTRIEEAYARIVSASGAATSDGPTAGSAPEPPTGPPPDLEARPGAFLRHTRAVRRTTLAQLAEETKVRASLLEILETENFSELPARVYVRGFVIQIARALQLEQPDRVAAAYLTKMDRVLSES